MRKVFSLFVLFALCVVPLSVMCSPLIGLTKGISVNDDTLDDLAANSIPYAVARCGWGSVCNDNAIDVLALINMGSSEIYYSLGGDMHIRSFNLTNKSYLGDWSLGSKSTLCPDVLKACDAHWQALRWGTDEVVEDVVAERFASHSVSLEYRYGPKGPGCLRDYPLRYGDVTGDGNKELALFLGDGLHTDFLVFSPDSKKLILSVPFVIDDVLPQEELARYLSDTGKEPLPSYPQVWSEIGANYSHMSAEMLPALRGYAKLYFGDFDDDDHPDIVVWRKLYESRLNSDPIKGFKTISQTYIHYALLDGVYMKQTTPEVTIQQWLADNNLTWQKGYPDKSECAGEEGQPVPEMSDPLLNDPDVMH